MKLTKKLETEILALYNKYWNAYLHGDMRAMASVMDENIQVVGSGKGEVFSNKKDTVKYYEATAGQVVGVTEMRNRKISLQPAGNNVLVTEVVDYFVLIDQVWSFYGEGRISTLFCKTGTKWLITQQHGSLPDARTGGGEQINTDKIKQENIRLQEAIKRRTLELEEKNRELEIETALERVRARTMAMQHSDELQDAAIVLFEQVKALGFDTGSCGFNLWEKDEKTATVWVSSPEGGLQTPFKLPHTKSEIYKAAYKAMQNGDDFFVKEVGGEKLKKHFDYLLTLPGIGEVIKKLRDVNYTFPESIIFHFAFFRQGYLSFHGHKEDPAAIGIFRRFAKVFEQTYTRFLDLKKAEAQARESQIEAALERVRSRTMAMQKSEELKQVVEELTNQFTGLRPETVGCWIALVNVEANTMQIWSYGSFESNYTVNGEDYPTFQADIDAFKKKEPFRQFALEKEVAKVVIKEQIEAELENIPDEATEYHLLQWLHNFGYVGFSSWTKADEEGLSLLERFSKVFEQTYTRFLDLQKAEAQAREAQIEAALERVRSRSMAMHKSEELAAVATILFQQVKALGVPQWACGFSIFEIDDKEFTWYQGGENDNVLPPNKIPLTEHPVFIQFNESRKRGDELYVYEKEGEVQKDHYRYMMTIPVLGEILQGMVDAGYEFPTFQIDHVANFSHGNLVFITYEHFPEMHDTFKRFAKVFEQTYTRFLDLQKAETQAREAQIEAALERVRSRSMAMHKSEELADLVKKLYKEIEPFGVSATGISIALFREEENAIEYWFADNLHSDLLQSYKVEGQKNKVFRQNWEDWKSKNPQRKVYLEGPDKRDFDNYILEETDFRKLPEALKQNIHSHNTVCFTFTFFKYGYFESVDLTIPAEENAKILLRFAKVFEQSYTRFLDLKKAEAQAREAQIEASLERVRARSMAMHSSSELVESSDVMLAELKKLNIHALRIGICTIDKETEAAEIWSRSEIEGKLEKTILGVVPKGVHSIFDDMVKAWKEKQPSFSSTRKGKEVKVYYEALSPYLSYPLPETYNEQEAISAFFFPEGSLNVVSNEPLQKEEAEIMLRFANVFGQIYRRFLDLQKVEAQAREAQIEAALERVRTKTMAMHNSDDVSVTVVALFDEVLKLGLDKSIRCGIGILQDKEFMETWSVTNAQNGEVDLKVGSLDMTLHPLLVEIKKTWKNNQKGLTYELSGKEVTKYYRVLNNAPNYPFQVDLAKLPNRTFHNSYCFASGVLFAFTDNPISKEAANVLDRFAGVFNQTYTRFLDLQKAEAQAREAQIETCLERVRSRTMGMQKSEELKEVIQVVYDQFVQLKLNVEHTGFILDYKTREDMYIWLADQHAVPAQITIPYFDSPHWNSFVDAKNKGIDFFANHLTFAEKNRFYQDLFKLVPDVSDETVDYYLACPGLAISTVLLDNIGLYIENFSGTPYTDHENNILMRFGKVFQQTYTRFLDLQKAEAQARESVIEAALEKVRGKAMAMHDSNDLILTAGIVFTELRKLGIHSFRSGVGLLTKENRYVQLYSATSSGSTDSLALVGKVLLDGHPAMREMYDHWMRQEDYFPVLKDDLSKSYYEALPTHFSVPLAQTEIQEHHGCFLSFSEGFFYGWSKKPYEQSEIKVLHRFRAIIDLTFRRYMELKKSEASALAAVRSATLDRVRAEIASMRTTDDLERITPLIWKELKTLGVPFVRCGVFIMDEQEELIHIFLSKPDGKAIAAFHIPFSNSGSLVEMIPYWRKKENYKTHWGSADFIEQSRILLEEGSISSPEEYLTEDLPTSLHLHFLPFLQGMLYIGDLEPLNDEHLQLGQNLADAFSTAYARYEDFNKLEEAKMQVEKTLTDLKQTQTQLIQAEKMASLGELTAGIAHEIQNPLNFVNNFSEVSQELLEEMQDELGKGDMEEVKAISAALKANLEKINNHGKRADAIVKGMLQHSRTSTGQKELTDINALGDEYLRLAYHGLRARDKSFNAGIETDFDPDLKKIMVIPQDIGRVLLNLINNAFHAVAERTKIMKDGYQPLVSLGTRMTENAVLVNITDNGSGIPEEIKDKIFQPFFTTKPTGQGTGLGLSLSYDIVKAHGGELKVESREGQGTKFVIKLPT